MLFTTFYLFVKSKIFLLSMYKKLLTLLCALMFIGASHAQSVWNDIPASGIPAAGERRIQPSKFRSFRMDIAALRTVLDAAP